MTRPIPASDLYDEGFHAWTRAQVGKLRPLQEQRANLDLDLPRLVEEVADSGKAERDVVRSQVRRIMEHCPKLEFSTTSSPRDGWRETIIDARSVLGDKMTPALRHHVEQTLPKLFGQAKRKAAAGLRRYGEHAAAAALPPACPYLLDDDWHPVSRHGFDP